MTKRLITPHKGGRSARIPAGRIRPQTLERIQAEKRERRVSFADLVEERWQGDDRMTKSGFKTIKPGDTVIYKGNRLPQYKGCEAKVTTIDYRSNMATLELPDNHTALVTSDQIEK